METILKTDNAYEAIEKINANFKEAGTGDGKGKVEDYITGNGDTIVYYYFPAKPGDYMHIDFPDGTWATKSSREGYNRLFYGWRDNDNNRHQMGELCREPWSIPAYGYDLYISDEATDVKDAYIGFRASSGTIVPFIISWMDRTRMKDYFTDEMADTVQKVRDRQGNECATLAICTDIHYRDIQEQYRPFAPFASLGMGLTMKELARRVRLDNIVCLGDAIDGLWSAAFGKRDARDMMRNFSGVGVSLLYAIGNHDDNRYYSEEGGDRAFTADEIHAEFIQNVDERTTVGGAMQGCNYYRDIDRLGIRIIVLMSINFNKQYDYTADTRQFLTDAFASTPEGYKAIIFTHTPLKGAHSYSGTSFSGGGNIETIIKNNRDKFIALFYGHTHFDNLWLEDFPEINMGCAKVYNTEDGTAGASAPEGAYFCERAAGDAREQLWDVVVVDKVNALLSCIRFGAGIDRYIHLTPVEVAAGGTATLTPSVLTADSWATRASETAISIASGVVSVGAGATSGSRLTAYAVDEDGNREYWTILVS